MAVLEGGSRRGLSATGWISGAMVIAGLALAVTGAGWWFLLLMAAGAFGPGLLRELGWLGDQDEFQRRVAHRAGYHAFLVTGFVACVALAYTRSGTRTLPDAQDLSMLYLSLLGLTWMFSALASYWGARRTAFRVLTVFGVAWGAFNVVSNLGAPLTMAMQLLVTTLPFFALAFLSRRWPRAAGALLLAAAAAFGWMFFGGRGGLPLITRSITIVLFVGPLVTSAIALFAAREPDDAAAGGAAAG